MKLSVLAQKMIKYIAIITAVLVVGGVILCLAVPSLSGDEMSPAVLALQVALGIIFSSLINVLKVYLLDRQVAKLSTMDDPKRGQYYASGQALLRFFITGAGLLAAHFIPFTNLFGAVVGAFTWNIAIYAMNGKNFDIDNPDAISGKNDKVEAIEETVKTEETEKNEKTEEKTEEK